MINQFENIDVNKEIYNTLAGSRRLHSYLANFNGASSFGDISVKVLMKTFISYFTHVGVYFY